MPQKEVNPWKIGKERPSRNPITNERTPRRNFMGWEFAVPPAVKTTPRWVEPEQALSILDKLTSQQPKIEAERKWKQESDARIRAFEESVKREKMMQLKMSSSNIGNNSSNAAPSSSREADLGYTESYGDTGRSGRSGYTETSRSDKASGRRQKQELTDIPVSHIRSLQKTCPAVLSNYRAQRAQQFIQTVSDPDPRAPRRKAPEERGSFRPPGRLTRHLTDEDKEKLNSHTKKKIAKVRQKAPPLLAPIPRSEADLLAELKKLTSALEDTNEAIERQTLKIALSKKVKTYEKRSTA